MGIKMLDHLTVCAINDLLHHDEERSTVEELAGLVRRGAPGPRALNRRLTQDAFQAPAPTLRN